MFIGSNFNYFGTVIQIDGAIIVICRFQKNLGFTKNSFPRQPERYQKKRPLCSFTEKAPTKIYG